MADLAIQQKAVETLVVLNTTITSLRLYPSSSNIITSTIDKLNQALLAIFEQSDSITFAEAEKILLTNGEPLSTKDMERPPVKAFLELLLYFGIRSITLEKGIEKNELTDFLQVIGRRQETIQSEGGLQKLLESIHLPHIILDEKIYIARDGDQQILASLDIKDDDIIQYMVGNDPNVTLDPRQLKEMAKDPEWIAQIFSRGMTEIKHQRETQPKIEKVSENLIRMISILEKFIGEMDQDKISLLIGKTVAELDPDMISLVLTQNIDNLFGGTFFQNIVDGMDEKQFGDVVVKIQAMQQSPSANDLDGISGGRGAIDRTCSRLLNSDRGKQFQQTVQEKKAREKEKIEKQIQAIKEKMTLSGDGTMEAVPNNEAMDSILNMADELAVGGEHDYIESLIRQLTEGLVSPRQDLRDRASAVLEHIIVRLYEDQQIAILDRLSDTLIQWIRIETSATSTYIKLCYRLKDQIADRILKGRFADCMPILDIFYQIDSGILGKNDAVRAIVSDIIAELASPELTDALMAGFSERDEKTSGSAGRVLARLGDDALNLLLNMLRDKTDSVERVRILHILSEIGQPAMPVIRKRLYQKEPWYFLRNLVYTLGRIGSQEDAELLGDFLLHENEKVRQEALKSIQRIGGKGRGPVLLSVLPKVDESYQKSIAEDLGNLKYAEAVPALMDLLKTRPLVASLSRAELEEKICLALGRIGSQEAVPLLTEISKPKRLFVFDAYPEKLKKAAAQALFLIKTGSSS
ncbi:MAG: HEAT repeat domain-containing protein [Deltaproteobacteria bacterium]|nr:HEAT repeat domain-containing protein [Deltaproteobacteria bacterium]